MSQWIVGVGVAIRVCLWLFRIPYPEHYSIIALAPQYNATKALEVVYQHTLHVAQAPPNAACQVDADVEMVV